MLGAGTALRVTPAPTTQQAYPSNMRLGPANSQVSCSACTHYNMASANGSVCGCRLTSAATAGVWPVCPSERPQTSRQMPLLWLLCVCACSFCDTVRIWQHCVRHSADLWQLLCNLHLAWVSNQLCKTSGCGDSCAEPLCIPSWISENQLPGSSSVTLHSLRQSASDACKRLSCPARLRLTQPPTPSPRRLSCMCVCRVHSVLCMQPGQQLRWPIDRHNGAVRPRHRQRGVGRNHQLPTKRPTSRRRVHQK